MPHRTPAAFSSRYTTRWISHYDYFEYHHIYRLALSHRLIRYSRGALVSAKIKVYFNDSATKNATYITLGH
jgi:hypothetical protein